ARGFFLRHRFAAHEIDRLLVGRKGGTRLMGAGVDWRSEVLRGRPRRPVAFAHPKVVATHPWRFNGGKVKRLSVRTQGISPEIIQACVNGLGKFCRWPPVA